MAKDPAFLFYSSDFLTGVAGLTMEERGQYITLLCLQHQKGHLTEKTIKIATADATADVMAKFIKDQDGNFFNERLEKEIERRAEYSTKQRERAKKGWEKRRSRGNATADATAMPKKENETGTDTKTKDGNGTEKKERKKPTTLFHRCIGDWCERYFEETELKYQWTDVEGRTLNLLLQKLRKLAEQQHKKDNNTNPVTDDEIFTFWEYLLNNLPKWYAEKADLKIINSKFNAIIAQIKNGNGASQDFASEFEKLRNLRQQEKQ